MTREEKLLSVATALFPKMVEIRHKQMLDCTEFDDDIIFDPASKEKFREGVAKATIRYADELVKQADIYAKLFGEDKKNF